VPELYDIILSDFVFVEKEGITISDSILDIVSDLVAKEHLIMIFQILHQKKRKQKLKLIA
jgi:hypothetical protein